MFSSASSGAAGGDLAEQRQPVHVGLATAAALGAAVAEELERARLRRVAAEQSGALEVREVRVHGRRRGEPDRLADLAHGRRVAVPVDVLDEEVPDLLLPCGQHVRLLASRGRCVEHVFADTG